MLVGDDTLVCGPRENPKWQCPRSAISAAKRGDIFFGISPLKAQEVDDSVLKPLMGWRSVSSVALWALVQVVVSQGVLPPALNPQLTNSVSNGNGPILYYNGSGPVPPVGLLSPIPQPLPPLR